jgi:hypothetical protein
MDVALSEGPQWWQEMAGVKAAMIYGAAPQRFLMDTPPRVGCCAETLGPREEPSKNQSV